MTGQPRSIPDILSARLCTIQSIASANAEHLRLSQLAGGMMVLDMKDEADGTTSTQRDEARGQVYAALQATIDAIRELELQLADLDRELEAAVAREEE
ncbi:hypothetical protein PVT71_28330 (plasmid) [Salipiger sp. H15]|uniref:Uncharacterized protein n=1 Tax=Alloyangia sp. H15 TaxID=3029062 RepID=A0AAU8ASZ1_9RHOB